MQEQIYDIKSHFVVSFLALGLHPSIQVPVCLFVAFSADR